MKKEVSSLIPMFLLLSLGCAQNLSQSTAGEDSGFAKVSFKLTDAPNVGLKSVFVEIDHLEVLLNKDGKDGRIKIADGLGKVDLLQLQNGITLALQDVQIPAGASVKQIRLLLKQQGHYGVKVDDSICDLKTPSAQKTGVKIVIPGGIDLQGDHSYNVLVDFDALKSVVVKGNGECLLRPVVKLLSVTKVQETESNNDDSSESSENESAEVGSDDNGAGEEIVVDPIENESGDNGDGWDYTPVVDGAEYISIDEDGNVIF